MVGKFPVTLCAKFYFWTPYNRRLSNDNVTQGGSSFNGSGKVKVYLAAGAIKKRSLISTAVWWYKGQFEGILQMGTQFFGMKLNLKQFHLVNVQSFNGTIDVLLV